MAISPNMLKEHYKSLSVEELEDKWNEIVERQTNKEKFIFTLVNKFMNASYNTNNNSAKQALSELLKEKTGKDYNIDENYTYELACAYEIRKERAKNLSIELNKDEKYLVSFDEVFNYVMKDLYEKDPFWFNAFKNFYSKLDFITEPEKLSLLLNLHYDKEDFNELSKELTKEYDIKQLYETYKVKCETFHNSHRTIG